MLALMPRPSCRRFAVAVVETAFVASLRRRAAVPAAWREWKRDLARQVVELKCRRTLRNRWDTCPTSWPSQAVVAVKLEQKRRPKCRRSAGAAIQSELGN